MVRPLPNSMVSHMNTIPAISPGPAISAAGRAGAGRDAGAQLPHQPPAHAPVCLHPLRVQSLFPPLEGLEPEGPGTVRFVQQQVHPAAREADGVLPLRARSSSQVSTAATS